MLVFALALVAATELRGLDRAALDKLLVIAPEPAVEQRLADSPLLSLSPAQLLEQYPRPQRLLKQLQRLREKPGSDVTPELGNDPDRKDVVDWLHAHGMGTPRDVIEALRAQKIVRAVYTHNPLAEEMVDFWFNHFNVSVEKGAVHYYALPYERDVIRPRIFGKFKDLLQAVAQSPAMLFYLDNFESVADAENRPKGRRAQWPPFVDVASCHDPNPLPASMPAAKPVTIMPPKGKGAKRGLNENYARELLELHTLGVDGGYTQADVREVARAFTGWTIFDPNGDKACAQSAMFYFDPQLHDIKAKQVLGHTLAGGRGIEDGLEVLDILAHAPATAHFIATKLVRRFVSDTPPPALVKKVTDTFTKSDGDIAAMLRVIFASPDFAKGTKTKRPFEFVVSALRATGAEVDNAAPLVGWLARMGEPLYACQPPTGYADVASAWVSQGALVDRLNFSLALASNHIKGTKVDLGALVGELAVSGGALDQPRVVDKLVAGLLSGKVSASTKQTLLNPLDPPMLAPLTAVGEEDTANHNLNAARMERLKNGKSTPAPQVATLTALVLSAPEFQRQ